MFGSSAKKSKQNPPERTVRNGREGHRCGKIAKNLFFLLKENNSPPAGGSNRFSFLSYIHRFS